METREILYVGTDRVATAFISGDIAQDPEVRHMDTA